MANGNYCVRYRQTNRVKTEHTQSAALAVPRCQQLNYSMLPRLNHPWLPARTTAAVQHALFGVFAYTFWFGMDVFCLGTRLVSPCAGRLASFLVHTQRRCTAYTNLDGPAPATTFAARTVPTPKLPLQPQPKPPSGHLRRRCRQHRLPLLFLETMLPLLQLRPGDFQIKPPGLGVSLTPAFMTRRSARMQFVSTLHAPHCAKHYQRVDFLSSNTVHAAQSMGLAPPSRQFFFLGFVGALVQKGILSWTVRPSSQSQPVV